MSAVLRTGQELAGYRIEQQLASGGMGVVLAMRFIEGTDLKQMIDAGDLSPERALRLLEQVASALDAAHEAGLVHRDVKPQNVLVDGGDRAYLADFGLTKSSGSRGITRTGAYLGSLDCVSPEQVRGDSVTSASDRYALAAVLYECLVGELPFPRDTEAALLYAHVSEPPPRVSERRPDLPATLDDLLARALAKEPGARYPTATQLVRDAQAALELRSPARTSTNAAGGGRPGFGETIVDPGLLRRAPAIAIEPERRFRTPPRLRRSRCSALVSPPRASCSGTVGPASSILHSASRSPARCP